MNLPPDIDDMNGDRAEFARVALDAYIAISGTADEDAICDLLCNLRHFCDREQETYGEFETESRRGAGHYDAEAGPLP